MKANGKRHATPQSLNAAVKSIGDVLRRSNVAGAMNYVPELTWILFLRILDEREAREAEAALGRLSDLVGGWMLIRLQ
jgi:type I restriction enzyme M protein